MPKSAKLAEFFQGHLIRFWSRGQAGNEVSERVGQLGGARLPKCLSELDKLYGVQQRRLAAEPLGRGGHVLRAEFS